jgi:hypothetical protein
MASAEAVTLVLDAKAGIQDTEGALDNAAKGRLHPEDLDVMKAAPRYGEIYLRRSPQAVT